MLPRVIHHFLNMLPLNFRDRLLSLKRYRFAYSAKGAKRIFIFLVDGKNFHGGLCDRFKGIISCYFFCQCKKIPFRLSYDFPFELTTFLQPNEYDWRLKPGEKSDNYFNVRYFNLIGCQIPQRLIKTNTPKQIHSYANRDWVAWMQQSYPDTNATWGQLYHQLFKPTLLLQSEIQRHLDLIGGDYICVAFRFQHLLGDFYEIKNNVNLTPELQHELLEKCKNGLLQLQQKNTFSRVLVTSDSERFVRSLEGMPNIFVFPGDIVHIDNESDVPDSAYLKVFLDFYLLASGKKIYSMGTDQMYLSDFPYYAAKVNDVPFERILL